MARLSAKRGRAARGDDAMKRHQSYARFHLLYRQSRLAAFTLPHEFGHADGRRPFRCWRHEPRPLSPPSMQHDSSSRADARQDARHAEVLESRMTAPGGRRSVSHRLMLKAGRLRGQSPISNADDDWAQLARHATMS